MSILDRLQRLARSEWSALRGEGARRELDAAIREAEAAIVDLRKSERTFHADYQDQLDTVQRHEDAAAAAVRAGDDALARRELWSRQEALEKADAARARLERVRRQIDEAVGMLRGARSQIELDTLDTAPLRPGAMPYVPPAAHVAPAPVASPAAPASTYAAPPVVPPPAAYAAPASGAYSGPAAAAAPVVAANPYASRPAATVSAQAPPGAAGSVAAPRPSVTAPALARFDAIGGDDGGTVPSTASLRVDEKLDHFEQIASRIDRTEAEALLDPADEARRTEAAIGDAFRRLEVERLRSSTNPDEDGALDRLRQRMGEGPPRD